MKAEVELKKDKTGRLSSKCWLALFAEFSLSDSMAENLPTPQGEAWDTDLVDTISILHADNPAAKRTTPLERYLEYCEPFNQTSLFGLLKAVMEGPTLPNGSAMPCQLAVLKYMERTKAHETYEEYWTCLRPVFDAALTWAWEEMSQRGISQSAFFDGPQHVAGYVRRF